jgi:hypothetical protein
LTEALIFIQGISVLFMNIGFFQKTLGEYWRLARKPAALALCIQVVGVLVRALEYKGTDLLGLLSQPLGLEYSMLQTIAYMSLLFWAGWRVSTEFKEGVRHSLVVGGIVSICYILFGMPLFLLTASKQFLDSFGSLIVMAVPIGVFADAGLAGLGALAGKAVEKPTRSEEGGRGENGKTTTSINSVSAASEQAQTVQKRLKKSNNKKGIRKNLQKR